ncbi:GlsB/YeaQ/YmgE family stress response membrane protein [Limibaculum sp. M0105]|uniref:GlsB/YeaQ/YmgE family stress response membrane protein n=1 Tax=Thermohalobaculum xanthum TaxID=2753746 RepID=A0A8J7MAD4_9RHOB|nr:GlsB/YeaQ/YmgE family stress response membrane protein [Thermohalobaculum xanthum]MBK0400725.1 GlsB/YeaQ/YmgE family stress response membrane protein [Thermohalobaculum xanthum]
MGGLILTIVIGAAAGWLAGRIMGSRLDIPWQIALGILGGVVGNWIAGTIGLWAGGGLLAALVWSTVGACVLIALSRAIR